jgi:hypothetical protein
LTGVARIIGCQAGLLLFLHLEMEVAPQFRDPDPLPGISAATLAWCQ